MIDKLSRSLVKNKAYFLALAYLILALMALFTRTPRIESSLEGYNIKSNPYDSTGKLMASLFASGNMVQVLVIPGTTNAGILLDGMAEAESEIGKAFPGIKIESLNSMPAFGRKAHNERTVKSLLTEAVNVPVAKLMVGRDTNSLLLVAFADGAENFNTARFDSIIGRKYDGIKSMSAISQGHIQNQLENSIKRDYMVLLPVILCIIITLLYFSFHSITAVLFCFISILLSFIPTLFFFTVFDANINQITTSAIPISVILSISATVHLLTGFLYHLTEATSSRTEKTIRAYFIPSFLSMLTTAIAFASFILSDSFYVRQFGLITACSMFAVFVITYMIAPSLLLFVRPGRTPKPFKFTMQLQSFLLKNNKSISIVLITITAISFFLIPHIRFRTDFETFIPRNTAVYNNMQEIKRAFHSIAEIDILVESEESFPDSSQNGNTIRELISLVSDYTEEIADYPEVSSVQSIKSQIDFEKKYSPGGIRVTLFPRANNPFVSRDQKKYRINVKLANSETISAVNDRLIKDFRKYEPHFKQSIYSDSLFFQFISSGVTDSLLRSLVSSALLLILILYMLTFNLRLTLVSILSNSTPLGFLVAVLVIFGIDMNITTSISLVVCLGLIVDDTIQILYRKAKLGEELNELGFGVLTTSLLITGGFLSFILSGSHPIQVFGVLCSVVFIMAVISDMTIMTWLLVDKKHTERRSSE